MGRRAELKLESTKRRKKESASRLAKVTIAMHNDNHDEDPPLIREFYDRGFLMLLENIQLLKELLFIISKELAAYFNFERAIRINRSLIPEDLQKLEADLLYHVPFRNGEEEVLVYLLMENQSTPDPLIVLRVLGYMVEIWKMEARRQLAEGVDPSKIKLSPILPIIFYSGARKWRAGLFLSDLMVSIDAMKRHIPDFETLFLNLHEVQEEVLHGSSIGAALRMLRLEEEPLDKFAAALKEALGDLADLPGDSSITRVLSYLVLLVHHRRAADERESLYNVMRDSKASNDEGKEVLDMAMTIAEKLLQDGREEGRTIGEEVGRVVEARKTLLRQGQKRFAEPNESVSSHIQAITDISVLEMLLDSVLDAGSWEDLLQDTDGG